MLVLETLTIVYFSTCLLCFKNALIGIGTILFIILLYLGSAHCRSNGVKMRVIDDPHDLFFNIYSNINYIYLMIKKCMLKNQPHPSPYDKIILQATGSSYLQIKICETFIIHAICVFIYILYSTFSFYLCTLKVYNLIFILQTRVHSYVRTFSFDVQLFFYLISINCIFIGIYNNKVGI